MTLKEADIGGTEKEIVEAKQRQGQPQDIVIAHWCMMAPGRSGMYETVKELIREEMQFYGVWAGLIDPDNDKGGKSDGWITSQSHGWAWEQATIHVSHYFMSGYATMQKPRVMMMHGTPEACFEAEKDSGSFTACAGGLQNLDAAIVLNKRHYAFWKEFDKRGVLHVIDKGVDLSRYKPKAMRIDCDGQPAIGIGEVSRGGGVKLALHPYWAINEYYQTNEKVRLHHWGVADERKLYELAIHKTGFDKFIGKYGLMGMQMFPENWYRGCNMLISPSLYGDPSRVHFEAMACGTPVIDWGSTSYADSFASMHAKPFDIKDMAECVAKIWDRIRANPEKVRQETRQIAEQHYDVKRMAKQLVEILLEVQAKVDKSPAK